MTSFHGPPSGVTAQRRRPLRLLIRGQAIGLVASVFALGVFAVYAASPVIQSGDSRLVVYESDSLLRHGNLDLHEYGPIVHGWPCYRERGRELSRYPYGTALLAAPLLAFAQAGARLMGKDVTGSLTQTQPRQLEKVLASAIAALAALALLLLAREVVGRLAPALALGVAFAFGTALWSTASRGLWQHGPAVLLTGLAMICLVRGRRMDDWRWSALAGLPLGMAFVVRPTLAVTIALAALILLVVDRKALAGLVAASTVLIAPAVAANLNLYGTVIVPVYLPGHGPVVSGLSPTLGEGLAGSMISPGRGLLIFSPFVVLGVFGLWLRRGRLSGLDVVAVGSILALWFSSANTTTWEAGASFGSRYLTDTLAFWAYLIAPVFALVVRPLRTWTAPIGAIATVLALTVVWSTFVHGRGAWSWATQLWNSKPTIAYTGDRHRLWDWSDPQFLRGGHATFDDLYPDTGLPAVSESKLCVYPT
jgi:hypothetical protein